MSRTIAQSSVVCYDPDRTTSHLIPPVCWFCGVSYDNSTGQKNITERSITLSEVQTSLNGNTFMRAVIPMVGIKPGNPNTISSTWTGGSSDWGDQSDIVQMQQACAASGPPVKPW